MKKEEEKDWNCVYPDCPVICKKKIVCPEHEKLADFILNIARNNLTMDDII